MFNDHTLNTTGLRSLRIGRYKFTARFLQFLLETVFLVGAFVLAYQLRFDFSVPTSEVGKFFIQLPIVVLLQVLALRFFGAHRFIWRYTSTQDARSIGAALVSVSLLLLIARSIHPFFPALVIVPISIVILDLIVSFVGVLGIRMMRREIYERSSRSTKDQSPKKSVIFVGAGQAGVMTLAEVKRRGDIDIDVKAFVDDDVSKHGAIINGVKVAGGIEDLPNLVKMHKIDHVIISIAQASRSEFQKILKVCQQIPIKVRTIPGLYELLQGNVTVSRIREIEVEDLLGRAPVALEPDSINRFLKHKIVMVTGAGGSIGSELVRQLGKCGTNKLILVERSEPALFHIEQEIANLLPDAEVIPVIADICDSERMENLFARFKPHVVFHAAAHKHVPLMERNASEALKNNVLGTKLVAELAGRHKAEAFVLISTDKAVFPTSVMGASKRLAELVIQHMDREYDTRFLAVRFGNVIGSNGSVIPTFREQIKRGGPVTVTDPEMRRYFMTIPEATQLVLQAGAIGNGGEILILDMGEPVKILDLARETIRLSGLTPDIDIQIKFVGVRPGEKLSEVLESDAERLEKTTHPKIFLGKIASMPSHSMRDILFEIPELCASEDELRIRHFLNASLSDANVTVQSSKPKVTRNRRRQPSIPPYANPVTV
ncbi:MAG: polysaccharide biosynthesis protein [Pyrinomonadaceae bacterium]